MPYINVTLNRQLSDPQRQQLAADITTIMVETLQRRAAVTAISIQTVAADHWFINQASPSRPTAFVQVLLTDGVDDTERKSRAIKALHAAVSTQTGPLHEASYIALACLPASDWGYDGKTQLSRQQPNTRAGNQTSVSIEQGIAHGRQLRARSIGRWWRAAIRHLDFWQKGHTNMTTAASAVARCPKHLQRASACRNQLIVN